MANAIAAPVVERAPLDGVVEAKSPCSTGRYGWVQRDIFTNSLAGGGWTVLFMDWSLGSTRRFYGRDATLLSGLIEDRQA